MKFFTMPSLFGTYVRVLRGRSIEAACVVLMVALAPRAAVGQDFVWSDSFVTGVSATPDQCNNWNTFLKGLAGKTFTSVKISGTYDPTGISITDPSLATELAKLLSSAATSTQTGTIGSIVFENRTWTVSKCISQVCGEGGAGVGLSIDATGCNCTGNYAIRPFTRNWGGVNTGICSSSPNQTMSVEFTTGVSITPLGPTTFCEGDNVILTANSETCSPPYTYLWSTGETSESITVSETGMYSVQVWGAGNCTGVADAISVTVKPSSVDAGNDATYCGDTPVVLGTQDTSEESVSKTCLFDSGGGNCSFTNDLCEDGYEVVRDHAYTGTVSLPNQSALRLRLYYSACATLSTFTIKLNGKVFETFDETIRTCSCTPIAAAGPYPRTLDFAFDQFKDYWQSGDNQVTVEVSSEDDVYMAGIVAEVSPAGFYTWSPSTGLSDATIRNPTATPESRTVYTVSYAGPNGCVATDEVIVDVCGLEVACQPVTKPLLNNCVADVSVSEFFASAAMNQALTYEVSPAGPYPWGTTPVTITVKDANGRTGSCSTTVTITDPTIPSIEPPAAVSVSNDFGLCTATVALEAPKVLDNCIKEIINDHPSNVFSIGTTTVTWTAIDVGGNKKTATQLVTVTNNSPVIKSIVGPVGAVPVGTNAVLGITYADDNFSHATIDWGDGLPPTVMTTPFLSFEVGHMYAGAGTYTANITLTDKCGGVASMIYEPITVFDPRSGSVSGGGWFDSPAGADRRNPTAEGRGSFSFDASYDGFSSVPQGSANFTFKAGNLKFKSNQFDLLLIDGEAARLTGTGTVNGKNGYDILISMVDDDTKRLGGKNNKKKLPADRIRVRVTNRAGQIIYDTQFGEADEALATTYIGSGSIEIDNNEFSTTLDETLAAFSFGDESTSVYPNPFIDYVNVAFATESSEDIVMNIIDLTGRVIATTTFAVSADGNYTVNVPETAVAGIYVLTIRQGSRIEVFTVIKN